MDAYDTITTELPIFLMTILVFPVPFIIIWRALTRFFSNL